MSIESLQIYFDQIIYLFNDFIDWISLPIVWYQAIIIVTCFLLAYKIFRPAANKLLQALLNLAPTSTTLSKLIEAVSRIIVPMTWLLLSWTSLWIMTMLGLTHKLLLTTNSLLTAWVIIQLLSNLIRNPSVSRILAFSAWLVAALNIFGFLNPVLVALDSWAITVGSVHLSILLVIKSVISLSLAMWLATIVTEVLERRLANAESVTPSMRVLISKMMRFGLIGIALFIGLNVIGIDLTALAVFSGALGVGLGFGLQKIFSNLVSGIILLLDRSIKPGDVIAVSDSFGWINYLGARYASVITRDGIEHLIPNEELITTRVENWSYSNNLVRLKIPIGISYKANPRIAAKLCVEAALQVPRIKKDPEPRCLLKGFGDNSVDLELRIWIDDPPNGRSNVISEALFIVWDLFHENGVEIPFPQRDLYIKSIMGVEQAAEYANLTQTIR